MWEWGAREQEAFEDLTGALLKEPVLKIPIRPGEPGFRKFALFTDASGTTIAAILTQADPSEAPAEREEEIKTLRPCRFLSRKMIAAAECNYSATEREGLAVVVAVKKFAGFLTGAEFTIYTDHRALQYLMELVEPTARVGWQDGS